MGACICSEKTEELIKAYRKLQCDYRKCTHSYNWPVWRGATLLTFVSCCTVISELNNMTCMLRGVWLFCDPRDCSPGLLCPRGFSRQEYWSGLPCPPPGHLPDPGIEPKSPALAGGFFTTVLPGKMRARVSGLKMTCHKWVKREDIPCRDLIHIFHSLKSDILLGTPVNWLQMTVLAPWWIHGLCWYW